MSSDSTFSYFNPTSLTNNTAMSYPFVLSTMAFPIFRWAKNLFTKKPVHLWLKCSVIYCFRLSNFTYNLTVRESPLTPFHYSLRGSKCDFDVIKMILSTEIAVSHEQLAVGLEAKEGKG